MEVENRMDAVCLRLDGNADAVEFCPQHPFEHILAAATYTLQENSEPSRVGSISLFSVHNIEHLKPLQHIKTTGIFDIKWRPGNATEKPCLLQADSDGFLTTYCLQSLENAEENEDPVMQNVGLEELLKKKISNSSMCLTADWQPDYVCSMPNIAAGLSDGSISVVSFDESQMQLENSWKAHEFEIWAIAFDNHQHSILYSGADDCNFCGWDVRDSSSNPIFRNRKSHQMGVCCIQKFPDDENRIVTGSYDESIRIWDIRMLNKPVVQDSLCLGGGVWKLKFHPTDRNLILAACMHNGFSIVSLENEGIKVIEEYHGHNSLAYGADWYKGTGCWEVGLDKSTQNFYSNKEILNDNGLNSENGDSFMDSQELKEKKIIQVMPSNHSLVATCSFYDKALHIWKPEFSVTVAGSSIKSC